MWVVKLGGSLMQSPYLQNWITVITELGQGKVVIVPGGGLFTDQVRVAQRRLQFDDLTAHKMALRAMEQFGLLLQNMEPRLFPASSEMEISDLLISKHIPIWFPYDMVADNSEIQASWDITSDSLALWLTEQLNCQNLILVKSTIPKDNKYSAEFLSQEGYLDKAFAHALSKNLVNPIWLSHDQINLFSSLLDEENRLPEMQIY
jgi:aspartokinase-like uncharacterized kinase